MARERLWLGGVDVADLAIRAIDLSGALTVPERRGGNQEADGRHGAIHTPRKKYRGRRAVFEFWLRGTLPDGTVPQDPKSEFYTNLHRLAQILAQDRVLMVHQLPDGTRREILVEVVTAVEPSRYRTGDLAKVGLAFDSADAFWQAQQPTTVELSLPAGATYELTEFAASDAPIDDALITFQPGPSPVLTQTDTGIFLAYDATIAAGQTLDVDCQAWRGSGTGGLVFDRTKLRTHPADGRWFALDPVIGGAPTVRLDHQGGATPMDLSISARQKWLFG
jgi:hypothetical protein